MAASAHLLLSALSKPGLQTALPRPAAAPDIESDTGLTCVFSAESACAEAPLTSEPPLPDAEPLTSEPPLSDAAPLTSESDAYPDAGTTRP
ncbi:hypothetical protein C3489_15615 [Streptomyces sp. Ru71]|uniref:hypothetical protein n=1 Tax=Streptomyces sp. Ru71 TaxID=2080746 RepID=UPI000CDDFFC4|nr:hypothetical protein [Streptomyces sp. Ru71]POX53568.1 hypothetical protein C3489_15615 [Streptomyces sp. Ru71]